MKGKVSAENAQLIHFARKICFWEKSWYGFWNVCIFACEWI